ncbi:hypothetical protein M422DRAFT_73490 [Sphaerobolus stellatus SS14]|nr:hypothetical protein M422DRAFT_73490 [Sphaerobolus stellatus SS14]
MPSEPIETAFVYPPALSPEQEEVLRTLELEGPIPLARPASRRSTFAATPTLHDLEITYSKEGFHVVNFDKGTGEDPREWSKGKKWYVTCTTAFLCLGVALGSSLVTGDMTGPTKEFGNEQIITNLSVTCFVIGFGLGPLIFAPLSEMLGRRPMYIASMFLYFIFTLPQPLAKNIATIAVTRQLAGIFASAPMCNVGGSIADVWAPADRGIPMALFSATLFMGPCIGPLLGGFIGEGAGWRWIYWVLFIFLAFCVVLTLFIPETLAPILLRRKAAALRKKTGDEKYRSLQELERIPTSEVLKISLLRPLIMMVSEPIILFMSFYLSFIYGLLYLLFFAFPIAFSEIRGFSEGMTGVTFVSIMLGILIAMCLMPLQEKIYAKVTAQGHFPEARLYMMMLGALVLPPALFIFAFTGAYSHVHWIAPCISGTLFGFALILIYVGANSYIVDSYSNYAASALAAKTLMRSEVGAMVPLFVNPMFHNMGFQYAGLLLALIATAIMPIAFFFFKYGGSIRLRSKRASKDQRGSGTVADPEKGGH